MSAVAHRWPNALIQFEDFRTDHALPLLNRYREHFTTFNDDIQGTGAVATAGLMAAMLVQGKKVEELCKQKILCVGAGSAGIGICDAIIGSMERMGISTEAARDRFWVMDMHGLLTTERLDSLTSEQKPFARHDYTGDPKSLAAVVNTIQPTILLGVSGAGKVFTEDAIRAMSQFVSSVFGTGRIGGGYRGNQDRMDQRMHFCGGSGGKSPSLLENCDLIVKTLCVALPL